MRHRWVVPCIVFLSLWSAGCDSDRDLAGPGPEPAGPPSGALGSAIRLRVDMKSGAIAVSQASAGTGTAREGLAPSFALLGHNEVGVTTSNFSRTPIGFLRVRIRFDIQLTNRLQSADLVTPTFPTPPAGVAGVLLFPFKTVALGANGQPLPLAELRAKANTDWNGDGSPGSGAPHNFFNSVSCGPLLGDDCFRWESFGTPLAAGSTSAAQTVGFEVDPQVATLEIYALLAADVSEPAPVELIAFTRHTSTDGFEIYTTNPDGSGQVRLTNNAALNADPSWSPDRSRMVFESSGEIWVMNANGTGQAPLTNNGFPDSEPAWSRDGSKIAFISFRNGNTDIWVMNADGTGQVQLTTTTLMERDPSWSPDGTKLAFHDFANVYVMDAVVGAPPTLLTPNPFGDNSPSWSPDGTKIAFVANSMAGDGEGSADDFYEVWVMDADGGNKVQLTNDMFGDTEPDWSPDGSRIVYTRFSPGVPRLVVMDADGGNSVELSQPVVSSSETPDW